MSCPRTAWATGLVLLSFGCAAPARAQEAREVYLPEARKSERTSVREMVKRLAELREAIPTGPVDRVAGMFDALLRRCGDPAHGNQLVQVPTTQPAGQKEKVYRGVRALLLAQVEALPQERRRAVRAQQDASAKLALASQRPPGLERLLAGFPLSSHGAKAARRLWERALEGGDLTRCRALAEFLARFHPAQRKALDAGLRLLSAARRKQPVAPIRTPPRGARLAATRIAVISAPIVRRMGRFSPSFPTRINDRICVSNGGSVHVYSQDGKELGAIPQDARAVGKLPQGLTGFQGRVAAWGGVAFTPLVLEPWMSPARLSRTGDASFRGRFYSLMAFAVRPRVRIRWWDGDLGGTRGGGPPGWVLSPEKLRAQLKRSHTLAVAACGKRVYVALTVKSEDPELYVMAYERVGGGRQPLVLRPAWPQPTFVCSTDRKESSEDEALAPEIAAALRLDGDGRLVCTTDVRVTACVDATTGSLLWVHEGQPDLRRYRRRSPFRPVRRHRYRMPAPPEPAVLLAPRALGKLAVFVTGRSVVAMRLRDGKRMWGRFRESASRLLRGKGWVIIYGGRDMICMDARGKQRFHARNLPVCTGKLARCGDSLLVPLEGRTTSYKIERFDLNRQVTTVFRSQEWAVQGVRQPINLLATPKGIVAASRKRVVFFTWQE